MRFFALLVFVLLAACTPNQKHIDAKDTTDLKERVTDYHMKMRWGMWDQAAQYIDPRFKQAFLGEMEERGEEYRIVSIEAKNIVINEVSADVEYEMEWHSESMVVKKEKFVDRWVLAGNTWMRQESMTKSEWRKKKQEAADAATALPVADKPNDADAATTQAETQPDAGT